MLDGEKQARFDTFFSAKLLSSVKSGHRNLVVRHKKAYI